MFESPSFEGSAAASDELVGCADALHAEVCDAQRRLFASIVQLDRSDAWRDRGARDLAHWLSMRYGISWWKADRWVKAARALEHLPRISEAMRAGELGVDKALELCRFATPDTEGVLLLWVQDVSPATVRRRADAEARITPEETREIDRDRSLHWWEEDDGRRLGLEAHLPAADGAVVVRAIERMTERLPTRAVADHEVGPERIEARRADALTAMCSAQVSVDPDPDRATIVVHASTHALATGGNAELESGGVVGSRTLARLACDARVQIMVEDSRGDVVRAGALRREPSATQLRQLRYRDRGCRFPGCGTRSFTHAHHIRWWSRGGATELSNLVLVCSFHHRLVHEHGWSLSRDADGDLRWCTPDGARYRAGPGTISIRALDPPFLDTG